MPTIVEYQFDPTGLLVANRITNEIKTPSASAYNNYPFIVPDAAPFFGESFQIWRTDTNAPLTEGVDFFFTHKFEQASVNTLKEVFGSVSFFLNGYQGEVRMTYQTIGGEWVLTTTELVEDLFNSLLNPRTVYWEQIIDLPYAFPAIEHGHDAEDTTAYSDLVAAVEQLAVAIEEEAEQNSEYATAEEALAGTRTDRIMSPATTALAISQAISGSLTGQLSAQYVVGYGHNKKLGELLFGEPIFIKENNGSEGLQLYHNGTNWKIRTGNAIVAGMIVELTSELQLINPPAYPRDLWLVVLVPNGITAGQHSPTVELIWNVAGAGLVYTPPGSRLFASVKIATVTSTISYVDLRKTQQRGFGLAFTQENPSPRITTPNEVIPKLKPRILVGDMGASASAPTPFRLPNVNDVQNPVNHDDWVEVERVGFVRVMSFNGTFDRIRLEKPNGTYEIGEGLDFNVNTALRFRWNAVDGFWDV